MLEVHQDFSVIWFICKWV